MLDDNTIQLIKKLYAEGRSKKDIAIIAHCSVPTVTKYTESTINIKSMIGQRFGALTVIKRVDNDKSLASRCIRYECVCDCGKTTIVNGNSLRTGHTTSCGCRYLQKQQNSYGANLTNQSFGRLKVLYPLEQRDQHRNRIWHCLCECGNECDVSSTLLLQGHTKSCGCLHSQKEIEIEQLLKNHNIDYKREFTFADLKSDKDIPLRFDFAIFQNNQIILLIEYQGIQHFDIHNNWHTETLVLHDQRKQDYCLKHGYPLLLLTKESDLEEILIVLGSKND